LLGAQKRGGGLNINTKRMDGSKFRL